MNMSAKRIAADVQHGAGHTRYRPDIDGLRSIAVLGVVLYHFGVRGFGGGYVGVDIFFVISGFLIGRSIVSDMRAGNYSLINFYERRIRRLYPAFVVVAAVSAVVFYFLLLPLELQGFGRSLVAAVIYMSNIAFYKDRGYFDPSATDKPLLHTWSLSVEEQFYVVFPIMVYLTVRWRVSLVPLIIAAAGIASFAAAERVLGRDADAAFFLFPYRAWELLMGVALTFIVDGKIPRWFDKFREATGLAGLAAIVAPIVLYTHGTPFPALAAMPPCAGTAMLILAGSQGTSLVSRVLATRMSVFVGLISYSYYLWHWPVLVALNYYYVDLSPLLSATGIAISFALATLSWRFVERPTRQKTFLTRKWLFTWAAMLSLLLAAAGYAFYHTNGLPGRFKPEQADLIHAEQDFIQSRGMCFDKDNDVYPGLAYCRLGAPNVPATFLAWGDSHGRAYRDGIDEIAGELGRAGILVWAGGCPPIFEIGKREIFDSGAEASECRSQNGHIGELLRRTPTLQSAILIGRWSYYTEGSGIGRDSKNRITLIGPDGQSAKSLHDQRELFRVGLTKTVDSLRNFGLQVFVLEQTPEFPQSNASIIARGLVNGRISQADVDMMTTIAAADLERRQAIAQSLFATLSSENKIKTLRTHDHFCGLTHCSSWIGQSPAMFDNNHVTVTTSEKMRNVFAPAIDPGRSVIRKTGTSN